MGVAVVLAVLALALALAVAVAVAILAICNKKWDFEGLAPGKWRKWLQTVAHRHRGLPCGWWGVPSSCFRTISSGRYSFQAFPHVYDAIQRMLVLYRNGPEIMYIARHA